MITLLFLLLNVFSCGSETEEKSEEGQDLSPSVRVRLVTCIFVLITILIVMSTLFEVVKDWINEGTSEKMKPVVEVLFSEMTVLGFLSLVTFCISKMGVLSDISQAVFYDVEDGGGWLEELLESVHYDLFLVMVLFIAQTLALIRLGTQSEKEWSDMDKTFADFKALEQQRQILKAVLSLEQYPQWWQFEERKRIQKAYALFEHGSLKKEFLRGRRVNTPFEVHDEDKHLPPTFDYSEYLTICLSKFMANIIEMSIHTWLFMEAFLILFYAIMFATKGAPKLMMFVWLGLGYALAFAMYQMSHAARWRVEMHVNPCDMPSHFNCFQPKSILHFHPVKRMSVGYEPIAEGQESDTERSACNSFSDVPATSHALTPILKSQSASYFSTDSRSNSLKKIFPKDEAHLQTLHPWRNKSHVTLAELLTRSRETTGRSSRETTGRDAENTRIVNFHNLPGWCQTKLPDETRYSFWQKALFGIGANRQLMLYPFRSNGPAFNLLAMRILLFMHSIYIAVLFLEFYEAVIEYYGVGGLIVYLFLGMLPTLYLVRETIPAIKDMVHIDHYGCLASQKNISVVMRNMKVRKCMSALKFMKNLQNRIFGGEIKKPGNADISTTDTDQSAGTEEMYSRIRFSLERSRMSSYSMDKSRQASFSAERKRQASMDTFKEVWREKMAESDEKEQLKEIKQLIGEEQYDEICRMFDVYDTDGGGEIDVQELKNLMRSLGKTMDDQEAEYAMQALDLDGSGTVSKLEFLIWHIDTNERSQDLSPEELAHSLFECFEKNEDGEITASAFMNKLIGLNTGLTVDEVHDLMRELDEDGSGSISEEEFANLLKKHAELMGS